jgi:N-glycosylase/DNA lyase
MNIKEEYNKRKFIIKKRLKEFSKIKEENYFYEACFCILTPQSSARQAWKLILELKKADFLNEEINPGKILNKRVRFYNNKSRYLLELKKKWFLIKSGLNNKNQHEIRKFLVENVKGYGYKEASHFLRNIGYKNLAILDRHILKNLIKLNVIKKIPKNLAKKEYIKIEDKFKAFSKKINIPIDELDLLFWSQETKEVFK